MGIRDLLDPLGGDGGKTFLLAFRTVSVSIMGRLLHSTQAVFEFPHCKDICVLTAPVVSHRYPEPHLHDLFFVLKGCGVFYLVTEFGVVVSSGKGKLILQPSSANSHILCPRQSDTAYIIAMAI